MDTAFAANTSDEITPDRPPGVQEVAGASRYFAAAAYHDTQFRRRVLEFARHGWYRARAPEFGIDEKLVTEHCRRAQWREHMRDLVMLAVFLVIAYRPLGWLMTDPEQAGEIISYFAPNLILAVLAAGFVLFVERLITEHYTTTRRFARSTVASGLASPTLVADAPQNLVVYGGYSPFVGSGYNVGGWSFSVNLERVRDEPGVVKDAIPFVAGDLLGFVAERLDRLGIRGLRYYHILFADGRLVRGNPTTLWSNGRLKRQIGPDIIDQMEDSPTDGTRSYLCINIADWSGEIVLSNYLRCKKGDTNLFIEASYFLLAPPKRSFFKIDEADPQLRLGTIARLLTRSIVTSVLVLIAAVFRLLLWVQAPIRHWFERRRIRRAMKRNPRFNFGAVTSIRELGMENYYRVYFQQLDKERHVKTTEQCTIDAIVEFLGRHNIDTSDIRDRRSTILNNGLIVAGGDLNAENLAVGSGAKALLSRLGTKVGIGSSGQSPGPSQSTRSAA